MEMTCNNCFYYNPNLGICQRYPPKVHMVPLIEDSGAIPKTHWPSVLPVNYCGEWERTKEAEQKMRDDALERMPSTYGDYG